MSIIEHKLVEEYEMLQNIIKAAKIRLTKSPKGQLRIAKKRNGVEYYYKKEGGYKKSKSNNGRYMRKDEYGLAVQLAQRDYDKELLKNAEQRTKCIEDFLKKYQKTSLEEVFSRENAYRQKLIAPAILPDEEFTRRWQAVVYTGKGFADEENEILTERGERVRSKSEKIIADKLYSLGIPYRYECPLELAGNVRIYPDFTILKLPEREEVYLEHFGMMDDADYVDTTLYKLNTYEKNKIYLGVNLYITHETSKNPLNTRALDGMLRKLFCKE